MDKHKWEDVCKDGSIADEWVTADVAVTLYDALVSANSELNLWREAFPQYADDDSIACQIDDAIALAAGGAQPNTEVE